MSSERTGVPIIPAHCEPLPNGRYRLVFHPKISNTGEMSYQQIAQACWDSFEPYVRKDPAPWLWMYKYWRFRPTQATRPYPFYSHTVRRFDKMLAAIERGQMKGGKAESGASSLPAEDTR